MARFSEAHVANDRVQLVSKVRNPWLFLFALILAMNYGASTIFGNQVLFFGSSVDKSFVSILFSIVSFLIFSYWALELSVFSKSLSILDSTVVVQNAAPLPIGKRTFKPDEIGGISITCHGRNTWLQSSIFATIHLKNGKQFQNTFFNLGQDSRIVIGALKNRLDGLTVRYSIYGIQESNEHTNDSKIVTSSGTDLV